MDNALKTPHFCPNLADYLSGLLSSINSLAVYYLLNRFPVHSQVLGLFNFFKPLW
jgi:hypothetical protein